MKEKTFPTLLLKMIKRIYTGKAKKENSITHIDKYSLNNIVPNLFTLYPAIILCLKILLLLPFKLAYIRNKCPYELET